MTTRPHVSQADRDLLADVGMADHDDTAGTGDHAQHDGVAVAS